MWKSQLKSGDKPSRLFCQWFYWENPRFTHEHFQLNGCKWGGKPHRACFPLSPGRTRAYIYHSVNKGIVRCLVEGETGRKNENHTRCQQKAGRTRISSPIRCCDKRCHIKTIYQTQSMKYKFHYRPQCDPLYVWEQLYLSLNSTIALMYVHFTMFRCNKMNTFSPKESMMELYANLSGCVPFMNNLWSNIHCNFHES